MKIIYLCEVNENSREPSHFNQVCDVVNKADVCVKEMWNDVMSQPSSALPTGEEKINPIASQQAELNFSKQTESTSAAQMLTEPLHDARTC